MRKIAIAAVGVTTMSVLLGPTAHADPGEATHIDSIAATVGTSVSVTGTATFVDVPVVVGQDADGASPNGVGADVRDLIIERPPGSNALRFTMKIDDQPPTLNGLPTLVYLWPLNVNGDEQHFFLMAGRAGGFPNTSENPGWAVMQNTPEGFLPVTDVPGVMGDGMVQWNAPIASLGAKAGDLLAQGATSGTASVPAGVRVGVHQLFWLGAPQPDNFTMEQEYTVPGAVVKTGIAPAGTDPAAVALTKAATANASTGAFSASLAKPATAGEYIVVAEACYTGADCVRASTTVTVT